MDFNTVLERLAQHEAKAQERYDSLVAKQEELGEKVKKYYKKHEEREERKTEEKEEKMEGIATDKVIVNAGGGGEGGGGMAALVAALGNRNQGDNTAALIAALGNRNGGNDGFGSGGGLGLIALLALLGRRGFGDGDGGHHHGDGLTPASAALIQSIMNGVNGIAADVPKVALESQAAIQQSLGQLALGVSQGLANVKDSVQATSTVNLVATKDVGTQVQVGNLAIVQAISNDGEKTRALIVANQVADLQRQLTVAETNAREEHSRRHSEGIEFRVSQTVNQAQAQAQQQSQLSNLFSALNHLANDVQFVKQGQTIFNSGTMAASGTQAAANTRVN